jgi:membrane protease subunit HflK
MAWNEPGGGGKKDPWGNRNNDGPPDLDEVFRKLQEKLGGLFGGKRGGGGGAFGDGGGNIKGIVMTVTGLLLAIWFFSGIYIVDEGERGVVLRFGKYLETTMPGPHWYPRLIQSVDTVNVTRVREADGSAHVLTGDENIVNLEFTIQYDVRNPVEYLFEVANPDLTLRQASESAFREVIGKNTLDYALQDGRHEIPSLVRDLLQQNLDDYKAGLNILSVNLLRSQPPQAVQSAFDDAIKSREDRDRFIQQGEAYRNEIIPVARGEARSMLEAAEAYRVSVVMSAQGESQRFLKLLGEYEKAPRVTRERLYLETVESILSGTGKVLVDVKGGNNLMYLPLDKIISGGSSSGRVYVEPVNPDGTADRSRSAERPYSDANDGARSRGAR